LGSPPKKAFCLCRSGFDRESGRDPFAADLANLRRGNSQKIGKPMVSIVGGATLRAPTLQGRMKFRK
jgi:hypothetical protein